MIFQDEITLTISYTYAIINVKMEHSSLKLYIILVCVRWVHWILVKVRKTQTQGCSARHRWYHLIILKAWSQIILGNVFGEAHTPCILKTSFVDLKKKCSHYEILNSSSRPNSLYSSSGSQNLSELAYPYLVSIYCWTCYRYEYSWNTARSDP